MAETNIGSEEVERANEDLKKDEKKLAVSIGE